MFLLVSLSKPKFFIRVALVSFVYHSCRTCVVSVALVSHLCRTRVARVSLVLLVSHSCCILLLVSHSCHWCLAAVLYLNNCKLVNILPNFSKMFERLLFKRISSCFDNTSMRCQKRFQHSALFSCQFGKVAHSSHLFDRNQIIKTWYCVQFVEKHIPCCSPRSYISSLSTI